MYPETALSVQAVQRLVSDPSLPEEDTVIFYIEPNSNASTSAWLSPMVQMEFYENPNLGMVYGVAPGYVWISSKAIRAIQAFAKHKSVQIGDCMSLIVALESLGYIVKQAGEQQISKEEIKFKQFVKTMIIAMIVGFAIGALIGSRFENWLEGGGTWLIGGSLGVLIAFLVTKKFLSGSKE